MVAGGFAPNRVRTHRVRTQLKSTLTAFAPKYAYYLEYFSFFKCEKNYLECFSFFKREKSVTTLVIGGGELGKGRERTRWVRTRLERNLHHSYLSVRVEFDLHQFCIISFFQNILLESDHTNSHMFCLFLMHLSLKTLTTPTQPPSMKHGALAAEQGVCGFMPHIEGIFSG